MKKPSIELARKLVIEKEIIVVLTSDNKGEAIPSCLPECYRLPEAIPSCMPECY